MVIECNKITEKKICPVPLVLTESLFNRLNDAVIQSGYSRNEFVAILLDEALSNLSIVPG